MYPRLVIDMAKLKNNLDAVAKITKQHEGCSMMIVTKALCADPKVVKMIAEHPAVDYIADSRVRNIKKNYDIIKANGKESVLLRLPMASEIEDLVKYVDISLNSEIETMELINAEAARQGKVHKAVLMIDVGDLREGIFYKKEEEIMSVAQRVHELENIEFYGVGVNLTCYGAVIPKSDNLGIICDYAEKIEKAIGKPLKIVSGGNSSSIYLIGKGELPAKINNLRLGEAFLLGSDTAYGTKLEGTVDDALTIETQIIELRDKPSRPIGEIGVDAFGKTPYYEDRGVFTRGIVAIGQQDISTDSMYPIDERVEILGASSDHMLLDLTKVDCKLGDIISFKLGYGSVLKAATSEYVYKEYK